MRTGRSSEHRQGFHVEAMVSDKFPMMQFDWYWLLKMRNVDSRLPGGRGTIDRMVNVSVRIDQRFQITDR